MKYSRRPMVQPVFCCATIVTRARAAVVRNKGMWPAILLCTTYVCAWFLARLLGPFLELRRILFLFMAIRVLKCFETTYLFLL
jgi:hypothetical protein